MRQQPVPKLHHLRPPRGLGLERDRGIIGEPGSGVALLEGQQLPEDRQVRHPAADHKRQDWRIHAEVFEEVRGAVRGEHHNLQLQRAETAVDGQDQRAGLALLGHAVGEDGHGQGAGHCGGLSGLQVLHAVIVSYYYFQNRMNLLQS